MGDPTPLPTGAKERRARRTRPQLAASFAGMRAGGSSLSDVGALRGEGFCMPLSRNSRERGLGRGMRNPIQTR